MSVLAVLDRGLGRLYTACGYLAALYGVSGDNWQAVDVPNRHGLLTQSSVMATHAKASVTNPITRGALRPACSHYENCLKRS